MANGVLSKINLILQFLTDPGTVCKQFIFIFVLFRIHLSTRQVFYNCKLQLHKTTITWIGVRKENRDGKTKQQIVVRETDRQRDR